GQVLQAASAKPARRVVLVGDSLLASAGSEVAAALINATTYIDAEPGRTTKAGIGLIETAVDAAPDALVIALGTNDWASTAEQMSQDLAVVEALVAELPCVVWIDAQEFRAGLEVVNEQLHAAVGRQPNVHLARWSAIAGPTALHAADGYHLSAEGRQAYASLIATAVDFLCR
ncbi:MAG: hypothetical protein P8N02_11625, partial [Actinomycetota bacterium]|nr:hypothetical protein [Actinomycetota bacterium]